MLNGKSVITVKNIALLRLDVDFWGILYKSNNW